MYTERNQTKKNKKALLLLLVLGVFGFVAFKITKINIANAATKNPEAASCATTSTSTNIYGNNDIFLDLSYTGTWSDITPELLPQKSTPESGQVLGTNCSNVKDIYQANSACTLSTGSASVDGNQWVNSDASIKMVTITYPAIIFSGQYSPKDSNRLITLQNPAYKPAGEQVDNKQILVTAAPGELHDKVKSAVIDSAAKQKAYGTKFSIASDGSTANPGTGSAVINQYAKNNCEECNNPSNSNPDKSNRAGTYLENIFMTYPGQIKAISGTSGEILTIDGACNSSRYEPMESDTKACTNVWNALTGSLGSLFPSSDWSKCSAGKEGCVNSETIVVKMSPMFDGINGYTKKRNKVVMDPDSSAGYKSVYVTTPCVASVGGKNVDIKCIWDSSYLFDELKVNEFDDVGGSNTPTIEQYVQYLQSDTTSRTDTLYSM